MNETSASFKQVSKFHFNTSCASELCSVAVFNPVPFATLQRIERAIAVFVANISHFDQNYANALGQLHLTKQNLFAIQSAENAGQISLFEFGLATHVPINLQAMRNSGLVNSTSASPQTFDLPALLGENPSCVEVFKAYLQGGGGNNGSSEEEEEALIHRCIRQEEFAEEDDHFDSNNELFDKAHELGLISQASHAMGKSAYLAQVMNFTDSRWMSIAWVPVFDSYHDGLGHGSRYDAILMELVEGGLGAESEVITRAGARFTAKHRRFAALITCQNDELEYVLKCIKHELGAYLYSVEQLVWGLGFVGDYRHYSELEPDWNADPVYVSHGEWLPRTAGEKQPSKQRDARHKSEL